VTDLTDLTPPTAEAATTPDLMPPTTEAATTPDLVAPGASDLCANCQAPLASDQRYCVNCGERRGKPRQLFQPATDKAPAPAPAKRERRPRASAGTTLIAGVATLLLAMGVGVLIGQNSTSNNPKQVSAGAPVKVTVDNGSGGGSGSTATASTGSKSKHAGKKASGKPSQAPVAHLSKKTTAAVNQGAANVVGTNQKLAPATVKVGGKCQSGEAGCQGGKFTGGFFGGG
jgi:hypothetical protein